MAVLNRSRKVDKAAMDDIEIEFKVPDRQLQQRRIPELLTGILLVLLGALLFVFWAGGDDSRPVVVMATDVARGDIIEGGDLVQVDLATSISVEAVDWVASNQVIGARAATALVSGQILTIGDVTTAPDLPSGFRGVGVIVQAGAIPTSDIGAGDIVDVVAIVAEGEATTIARDVPIRTIGSAGEVYWVTLVVADAQVEAVAAAAHNNSIRLAKVPAQ